MKHEKRSTKSRTNSKAKHIATIQINRSAHRPAKPTGPPLAGEALEHIIAEVLCEKYRDTAERKLMRSKSNGASDSAIEAALVSPRVLAAVKPVARAHAVEQAVALIRLFFRCARTVVESDKAGAGQSMVLKILVEILLAKLLNQTVGDLFTQKSATSFTSAFEQSVIENTLELLRDLGSHAAEATPESMGVAVSQAVSSNGEFSAQDKAGG